MKLREQILSVIDPYEKYPMCFDTATQCEKIADDFAIGFSEFLYDCALNETFDNKSLKELLEIYKKEKGL